MQDLCGTPPPKIVSLLFGWTSGVRDQQAAYDRCKAEQRRKNAAARKAGFKTAPTPSTGTI